MITVHKSFFRTCALLLAAMFSLAAAAAPQLSFSSSDTALQKTFDWARDMAMSYVHDGSDPVGLWYEAALPGRDAFCMRDLSHQVVAAEILGLSKYNANMLGKIAAGISESKDWCSFWEIDRLDRPAPCDYANDKEFWYNLPANFDVLRACREAFEWSGDSTYIQSPEFTNFYYRTAHDYADRWNLTPDSIMSRRRFMNTPEPFNRKNGFHTCRGLPSYAENFSGITVAIDLLGAIMTGYEAYAFFGREQGSAGEAAFAGARADAVGKLIENEWWDETNSRYNTYFTEAGEFHRGEGIPYMLLIGAIREPERAAASVADVLSRSWNVENLSAFPVFLYRLGFFEDAGRILVSLPTVARCDYPEVSFGAVEGLICGALGVQVSTSDGSVASCNRAVEACSAVRSLPFMGGTIDIEHDGRRSSSLTNNTSAPLTWRASFVGAGEISVPDGETLPSEYATDAAGNMLTNTAIVIQPGETVSLKFVQAK